MQGQSLDYNEQFIRVQNEQMLLNLVRLRYGDMPLFLELNSIVTQYSIENSIDMSAFTTLMNAHGAKAAANTTTRADLGRTFAERPTISYTPLQGEAFAERILSPISPQTIVLLSQSGWSISRLLTLCVKHMNGIENALAASGPTPDQEPVFEEFKELVRSLRELQKAGILVVETEGENGKPLTYIIFRDVRQANPQVQAELKKVRSHLGLNQDNYKFKIAHSAVRKNGEEISVSTRSLLGVLFFLSHAVQPPEEHKARGLVAVTRSDEGPAFDWAQVLGDYMTIYSGKDKPADSFVSVRYRDHWYYVLDNDLNSKATFGLVNYLFALQAAEGDGRSPLLTISAGA